MSPPKRASSRQGRREWRRCCLCGQISRSVYCYAHSDLAMNDDFNDKALAQSLAMLPQNLVDEIQATLDEGWPGEFEVVRAPDGAIVVVGVERDA